MPVEPVEQSSAPRSDGWSEPGAHPVAPGVHRLPLPLPGDGLRAVNVYAVAAGDGITLVDAGWHRTDSWEALQSGLRALGAAVGDVRRVLVTHTHHDHFGQAPHLRRAAGAVVLIGEGEAATIDLLATESVRRENARERMAQLHSFGAAEIVEELRALRGDGAWHGEAEWEPADELAADGAVLEVGGRRLEVVATPGHTRGHIAFLDRDAGLLFAGDHVLPHITPSIGLEPRSGRLVLADFLMSLAKVRGLPVRRVLPAHGPDFEGLDRRVDELMAHHEHRLRACLASIGEGERSSIEVARTLPWTRRERAYADLDLFNRLLAVHETAAHLELLAAEGSLAVRTEAGVRLFRQAVARP